LTREDTVAGEPILVVDDNAQNLKLARIILTAEGYLVRTAVDAEDALTILESFTPRVILMDLQLPRMDGLALTRQLKRDPRRRDIVIIAVTAYAMKGDEDKAREAGCDDYMSKPIDARALSAMIARHVQGTPDPLGRR
jgi:two-component system cell cycle response regulator DivK